MYKIYLRVTSSFDARVGSAECQGIQILTIRYFNSFRFFGHPV